MKNALSKKIIFFGTSDYCLPILETLHKNFELSLVVTRPDKPVGRRGILTESATKIWAKKNIIKINTPETLKKDTDDRNKLINLLTLIKPDLAVVSDYGLIIPEKIFQLPKYGTINVHFSKLPDLRGPSPVQSTLLRGDKEAWVTIFKLENPPQLEIKMDSGPIMFQQSYPILPDDTTISLYNRLFFEAAKNLSEIIQKYSENKLDLINQDHSKATFCKMLSKEDGFVKWEEINNNPIQTYHRYQAMTTWPGLWTFYPTFNNPSPATRRMKILKCHLDGEKMVLDQVQFEGKNPIAWKD